MKKVLFIIFLLQFSFLQYIFSQTTNSLKGIKYFHIVTRIQNESKLEGYGILPDTLDNDVKIKLINSNK